MKTIRNGTFETNSSSTHSIIIMTEEEYNNWENNKLLLDTKSDLLVECSEENLENSCCKTIDSFYDDCYLEIDTTHYTSPSGDKLIIICQHGNDF